MATIVKGVPKAPFSIATTPRCRGGRYSFPGLLHFTLDPYLIMLSVKQGGIKYHFWAFGMTRPGIEPRSPGPLANTLTARPMSGDNIYILPSTNRLFRCITTLPCGQTRKMLQVEIETRLTLRQSNISSQNHRHSQRKLRNFLRISFLYIRYQLLVCSIHAKIFAYVTVGEYPTRVLPGVGIGGAD